MFIFRMTYLCVRIPLSLVFFFSDKDRWTAIFSQTFIDIKGTNSTIPC